MKELTEKELKSIDSWIENVLMQDLAIELVKKYHYDELETATMKTVTALRNALICLGTGNAQASLDE